MSNKLKKSVRGYLESKQLNSEQLDNLTQLMNSHETESSKKRFYSLDKVAAVLVLAIVAGVFWSLGNNKVDVAELIAEEVAYNHLKMKPMEVSSESLNDMRNYFSKLDFSLSRSEYVVDNGLTLIGGRYCSIQGDAAAQLRMLNKETGDIQIVYQAPYNKELFQGLPKLYEGQDPTRHYVNGIAVDVWVEQGVLFARSFKQ